MLFQVSLLMQKLSDVDVEGQEEISKLMYGILQYIDRIRHTMKFAEAMAPTAIPVNASYYGEYMRYELSTQALGSAKHSLDSILHDLESLTSLQNHSNDSH